jgi:hypothetical protein
MGWLWDALWARTYRLRRALARAGIVEGRTHVCRRKARDAEPRRCPRCSMKLWPKAKVRPIRFHNMRHTTGSLLTMAGGAEATVRRVLRHRNPRMTDIYQHLAPEWLQSEVNRLQFGLPALFPSAEAPSPDTQVGPVAQAVGAELATRVATNKTEKDGEDEPPPKGGDGIRARKRSEFRENRKGPEGAGLAGVRGARPVTPDVMGSSPVLLADAFVIADAKQEASSSRNGQRTGLLRTEGLGRYQ